jgi:3-deoxy-D-manno-octulosonic-acid transferase
VEIISAGDTRFDQVCWRIDTSTVKLPDVLLTDERSFLIAGSTWPRDEEIVIPGFKLLLEKFPDTGLILAPHEPTPDRLVEVQRLLKKENLSFHLLSTLNDAGSINKPVVVADGVGYLAELYRTGCIVYVGGSFTTGVHNVMEPAVLGLPVLYGPRINNSYEARKLLELEAGRIVRTPVEFKDEAVKLLGDRELLKRRGETASQFIRNNCGASLHCVDLIEKHMKKRKAAVG